jgi:hypothetical protein
MKASDREHHKPGAVPTHLRAHYDRTVEVNWRPPRHEVADLRTDNAGRVYRRLSQWVV